VKPSTHTLLVTNVTGAGDVHFATRAEPTYLWATVDLAARDGYDQTRVTITVPLEQQPKIGDRFTISITPLPPRTD
jgi:hypothetical protein